ncbi:hypothetical protein D9757_006412 [Collybiopsis confluens]|uniref:Uncharacterized protein n=1 Tax=Collybiopsis confluens TaxID=2823264 RepID=A0A8H5M7W1_9AGAR|nr:hypothetical protein D9757_006412 [Collybiopsis confluens]
MGTVLTRPFWHWWKNEKVSLLHTSIYSRMNPQKRSSQRKIYRICSRNRKHGIRIDHAAYFLNTVLYFPTPSAHSPLVVFTMFPKLVALNTDGTIWAGRLDEKEWGKPDNIHKVDEFTLENKRRVNTDIKIKMNPDIPKIINEILKNDASLAIVSRNSSKALSDRALYYFKAKDKDGETKSIIDLVRYDEVVDEPLSNHFKRIHEWSKFPYADMVYFDIGSEVPKDVVDLGVTVIGGPATTGLTWERYKKGLEEWERRKGPPGPPKKELPRP